MIAENPCGDWEPYKEEKCIKLLDSVNTHSFADAEKICAANDSKLINIHFHDDQTFFENYLFTKKSVVDNVWLGAKNDSIAAHQHVFHWSDGSNLTFTNWASGYPKVRTTDSCVQMNANDDLKGKWSNEPCAKKNLVVCEKAQTWSLKKLQALVVQTMQNPVPFGFIYVQLPKEKSPQEIWPWMSWTDVSSTYDSVFFRVAGSKGAAAFGDIQEEFSPYIDEVNSLDCLSSPTNNCHQYEFEDHLQVSRSGGLTKYVRTANGYNYGKSPDKVYVGALNFHTAAGEVRPRNMAVKVWKRTG